MPASPRGQVDRGASHVKGLADAPEGYVRLDGRPHAGSSSANAIILLSNGPGASASTVIDSLPKMTVRGVTATAGSDGNR